MHPTVSEKAAGAAPAKLDGPLAAPATGTSSSSSSDAFRPAAAASEGEPLPRYVPRARGPKRWSKIVLKYFIDPRRSIHKYFVFFLAVCFIPGPYFHDTLLSTYKAEICSEEGLNISSTKYAWLFGLPSMMGALSGPMASVIHRWGDARLSFISGSLTFVAAVAVTVSLQHKAYNTMLIARMAFWFGTYLMISVQMCVVYKLFTGPELAVAMGLLVFGCRLGGTVAFLISGFLLELVEDDLVAAMWLSNLLVGFAMLAAVLFAWLRAGTNTARTIIPLLEHRRTEGSDGAEAEHRGLASEMRDFTPLTWSLIIQIAFLYATIFPFETIETDFLEEEWGVSLGSVGWFTSLGAVFGLFSWAWGFCITSTDEMLRWCLISWCALIICFMLMLLHSPDRQWLAAFNIGLFGVAYSYLSTTAWTLIPLTFEKGKDASTGAVSIAYVIMSFFMLASQLVTGMLHDLTGSYGPSCLWFVLLSGMGLERAMALRPAILAMHGDSSRDLDDAEEEPGRSEVEVTIRGVQSLAPSCPDPVVGATRAAAGGWPVAADTSEAACGTQPAPAPSPQARSLHRAISDEAYFGGNASGMMPGPGGAIHTAH